MSPDDWLDEGEVRAAARAAFAAVVDPLQRRALELRFGLDQGGSRRSPAEVGHILGGKYVKNAQTAGLLVRNGLNSIPLVADDPSALEVLHEDGDIVAVSKPPFLRTTPVHRFCGKSLSSQLVGYLRPRGCEPFIVHRLDQSTSGVYLCAKTSRAAAALQDQWHTPSCSKRYLAVVHVDSGHKAPVGSTFVIDAAIARGNDEADSVRRVINDAGQSAATRFEVLARGPAHALFACTLLDSGRTHQIRLHSSHAGFPLVGDSLYGGAEGEDARINRVALHAWRLRFAHPRSGEASEIIAPPPADLERCCAAHGIGMPFESLGGA